MPGSCEHGSKPSDSMKAGSFLTEGLLVYTLLRGVT
jgi:hypothetical protein